IQEITNHFRQLYRLGDRGGCALPPPELSHGALRSELIASVIPPIVAEKATQYRYLHQVEITYQIDPSAYGAFVRICSSDFTRVLANLIDNAVHALSGRGRVAVSVSTNGNSVEVCVTDTGVGVASSDIPRVLNGTSL